MKRQDFEFEECMVTEAVGLALHGFDLVVSRFQGTGGVGVIIALKSLRPTPREDLSERPCR